MGCQNKIIQQVLKMFRFQLHQWSNFSTTMTSKTELVWYLKKYERRFYDVETEDITNIKVMTI